MSMKNEVNSRISRRQVLGTLGAMGAVVFTGCGGSDTGGGGGGGGGGGSGGGGGGGVDAGSLSCVVTPSQTEGPFFVDEKLNRSDITSGTTEPFVTNGLPFLLTLGVYK